MANRLFILLLFPFSIYAQDLALGEWKYHLSFESNVQITENEDRFFVATESGLFTLDKQSNELNTFDQTNVLSDIGVSHLHYDQETGILFIGYTNGNIDLVADGITQNLVDIKQSSSISGSRQINDVLTHEGFFYVATGYGISVIDPDRFEVKETVFMGELGTESQVHQIAKLADTLFAATNRGLFYTTFENPLFTNIEAWSRYTDFPDGESDGPINQVVTMNGELFANYHNATINDVDIIYRRDEGFWTPIRSNLRVRNLEISSLGLVVCTNTPIFLLDRNGGQIAARWNYYGRYFSAPDALVTPDTAFWYLANSLGLVASFPDTSMNMFPEGPRRNFAWTMNLFFGELWVTGGSVTDTWGKNYNSNGIYSRSEGKWYNFSIFENDTLAASDFNDVIAVAVNQNDPKHVFVGSFGSGLAEFRDHRLINNWYAENLDETSLRLGDYGNLDDFVGIGGLTFDANNNLWITNTHNDTPVSVFTADRKWSNFTFGNSLNGNYIMGEILACFNSNQKWVVRFRDGLLVFDDNGTPLDATDDQHKVLTTTPGFGGLPNQNVRSIAEDLDGEIWVGTEEGPCVFYSPGNIFSGSNFDASQILIERGGNVEILLGNETITSIAIDGGNRKWMATVDNGVYLLSEDGTEEIHHFTVDNSPLLTNYITDITIDYLTGEVFFASPLGLVSFRSDATAQPISVDKLKVFPNPVRNDYFGPIAIDGSAANSSLRITDATGNVVNLLESEGGMSTWDGTDFNGDRVATGVYFILAVDRNGEEAASGKVLFIQ